MKKLRVWLVLVGFVVVQVIPVFGLVDTTKLVKEKTQLLELRKKVQEKFEDLQSQTQVTVAAGSKLAAEINELSERKKSAKSPQELKDVEAELSVKISSSIDRVDLCCDNINGSIESAVTVWIQLYRAADRLNSDRVEAINEISREMALKQQKAISEAKMNMVRSMLYSINNPKVKAAMNTYLKTLDRIDQIVPPDFRDNEKSKSAVRANCLTLLASYNAINDLQQVLRTVALWKMGYDLDEGVLNSVDTELMPEIPENTVALTNSLVDLVLGIFDKQYQEKVGARQVGNSTFIPASEDEIVPANETNPGIDVENNNRWNQYIKQ
jgi:hypothetical protein